MKLAALWLEYIETFEPTIQESLLREAPHTAFQDVPTDFEFLIGGFVDLGFENLGLTHSERQSLERAFSGSGVVIPGTKYSMRHVAPGRSVIELATNQKPTLPAHWRQVVLNVDINAEPPEAIWIGRSVRKNQIVGFDTSKMIETPDGWRR